MSGKQGFTLHRSFCNSGGKSLRINPQKCHKIQCILEKSMLPTLEEKIFVLFMKLCFRMMGQEVNNFFTIATLQTSIDVIT